MKLAHIITSIAFSSALMGCQIEVTPLEEDTVSGSVAVTENSTVTTDTTTADNTSAVTETTDTAANQDATTGSDSATTDETTTNTDTAATDESTVGTDTGATDTAATDNTDTVTTVSAATLYWSAPLVRANGAALSFIEIGGYEIRYKLPADVEYNSVIINDASVEQYSFDTLDNAEAYSFEVAAFDVNGIYSEFVAAN